MYIENGNTSPPLGAIDQNLTVETSCTQQGGIKDLGSVSRGQKYNPG